MPFVKVPENELVIGEEYVITHIGCKSKAGDNGTSFVRAERPLYRGSKTMYETTVESCERVETAPGSVEALGRAYKTWKRINPPEEYGWARKGSMPRVDHGVQEMEYRKRAFFAGVTNSGIRIFTQDRPFGSKKSVAFEPVDVSKKYVEYGNDWVAWREVGGASAVAASAVAASAVAANRGNNAATRRNNAAAAANVPTGNLLGLNNKPRMSNGNNATRKGRENWYKQHEREQEMKNLFGGRRRTARRRRALTI